MQLEPEKGLTNSYSILPRWKDTRSCKVTMIRARSTFSEPASPLNDLFHETTLFLRNQEEKVVTRVPLLNIENILL